MIIHTYARPPPLDTKHMQSRSSDTWYNTIERVNKVQQRDNGDVMNKTIIQDGIVYNTDTFLWIVDNTRYECIAIYKYHDGGVSLLQYVSDGFVATRIYAHGNVVFNFVGVNPIVMYTKLLNLQDGVLVFDGKLVKVSE